MAELTQTQLEYIDWRANPQQDGSKTAWAAEHGVSDDTLRRWEKTVWFREAMERKLAEYNITPDRVQQIIDALHRAAVGGDTAAAMKYLQYVESLQPSRTLVEDVKIESLTDEELQQAWEEGLATVVRQGP